MVAPFRTIATDGDRPLELSDLPERPIKSVAIETRELTPEEKFDRLPQKTKDEIMAGRRAIIAAGHKPADMSTFDQGHAPTPVALVKPEPENLPLNFSGHIPERTALEQAAGRAVLERKRTDYANALAANARGAAERLTKGVVTPDDMSYNPQG